VVRVDARGVTERADVRGQEEVRGLDLVGVGLAGVQPVERV
jgi:hypothetical protein